MMKTRDDEENMCGVERAHKDHGDEMSYWKRECSVFHTAPRKYECQNRTTAEAIVFVFSIPVGVVGRIASTQDAMAAQRARPCNPSGLQESRSSGRLRAE